MTQVSAAFFDIDDTLCATTEFAKLARRNAIQTIAEAGLKSPVEGVLAGRPSTSRSAQPYP